MSRARAALAIGAALLIVAAVQQALVSAHNFGGADEWLLLDLSSRGILGVPYANRPLVLFWHALPARLWPGSLAAFWAFAGLYRLGAGLLTAAIVLRLAPGRQRLALIAGACAVAWTPLDHLRLDAVLICGYEGVTLATMAAVLLFVESWYRRSPWLLVGALALSGVAALSVESVIPVLAVAPAACWRPVRDERRRFAGWALAWEAVAVLGALHAAWPVLTRQPSYQTGALGLDASPLRVAGRVLQLLGMQLRPLLEPLAAPLPWPGVAAVLIAALAFAAGYALLRQEGTASEVSPRRTLRALATGLLFAAAAHATMALVSTIRTPARTQIVSGPGMAIALAAVIALLADRLPRRWRAVLAGTAGAWIVACGTARVAAMQAEWDGSRSLFPAQAETLARLTAAAPSLVPGTVVLLLDDGAPAWPMTFTFRHALRYLYGDGVVGEVIGANDFLYPSRFTSDGLLVTPLPAICAEWQVRPSFHPWDSLVVARRRADGSLVVLADWPADLPPLPASARYAPQRRIEATPVHLRERRVLQE